MAGGKRVEEEAGMKKGDVLCPDEGESCRHARKEFKF